MSSHPNAMLMAVFTPDDLARKTYRAIRDEYGADDDDQIVLGGSEDTMSLILLVMEEDFHEDFQIAAPEGSIVAFDYITYGYGQSIPWAKALAYKEILESWAIDICRRHKCSYEIKLSANFW